MSILGALSLAGAFVAGALAPSPGAAAGRMDFELATLSGDKFVRLDDFVGRPVLINVWGSECPPCIIETPLLDTQSQIYKSVQFLGIGTDDRISSLRFADRFHIRYPELQAPTHPSGLLRRLGDTQGALPFTVVLDARHQVCASRQGAVDAAWISDAVKTCTAD
jgi:thiol-disulfide isomerase/thioredoxin